MVAVLRQPFFFFCYGDVFVLSGFWIRLECSEKEYIILHKKLRDFRGVILSFYSLESDTYYFLFISYFFVARLDVVCYTQYIFFIFYFYLYY